MCNMNILVLQLIHVWGLFLLQLVSAPRQQQGQIFKIDIKQM